MAEAFGIVAGAFGIATVLKELKSGIDTLRQLRDNAGNTPVQIQNLAEDLSCLLMVLEELAKIHGADHPILQHCKKCCEDVASSLSQLKNKIATSHDNRLKRFKFVLRDLKCDLEELEKSLLRAKTNMSLAATIPIAAALKTTEVDPSASSKPKSSEETQLAAVPSRPYQANLRRGCWAGSTRRCSCSCHNTTRITQGFYTLDYTPFRGIIRRCDNESCDSWTVGGSLRLGLTKFWSIIIQAQIAHREGSITLRPSLDLERTVPSDSPGFVTMRDYFCGQLSLEEAKNKLWMIYRSDPTFKNHVNSDGKSYIQKVISFCVPDMPSKLKILEFLLSDLRMTRGLYETNFLIKCANTAYIGRRGSNAAKFLEGLIRVGFDLMDSPWPLAETWPSWLAWNDGPCLLGFLGVISRTCQGFAGMTPLHDAVLIEPVITVKYWASKASPNQKNFLGQTPLHLAVRDPWKVSVLIESGSALDAQDYRGMTPLMYAAAMNATDSVIALLEAGADITLQDTQTRQGPDFIDVAAYCRNWRLILAVLPCVRTVAGECIERELAEKAAAEFAVTGRREANDPPLKEFIRRCRSPNLLFGSPWEGDTFMHHVRSQMEVYDLLDAGFTLLNHVSEKGRHCLMEICVRRYWDSRQSGPLIIKALVEAGADLHLQDPFQRTALDLALMSFARSGWLVGKHFTAQRQLIRQLLQAGVDCMGRDNCSNLLAELRAQEHDELDMTHLCCRRGKSSKMTAEDMEEIAEEESVFVGWLDSKMKSLEGLSFKDLQNIWFRRSKDNFDHAVEDFERLKDGFWGPRDRVRDAAVQYKYGISFELCFDTPETPRQNDWRRWLIQRNRQLKRLLGVLGIPLGGVADRAREMTRDSYYSLETIPSNAPNTSRQEFWQRVSE